MRARPPTVGGQGLRANRIFARDGRAVVVALDHTMTGVTDLGALGDVAGFLAEMEAAGVDAVLVPPGVARQYADRFGRLGVIVRLDGGPTSLTGDWNTIRPLMSVNDALRLGADAVAVMGLVGTPAESESLTHLGTVAAGGARQGLPVLAEMLPGGWDNPDVTVAQIAAAARIGADLGATMVKVPFRGEVREFRQVTNQCYVPVLTLGGGQSQSAPELVRRLADSLLAGASGVAVGRGVWLSRKPADLARELVRAVHGTRDGQV
jgi:DhnA family fructose-bisphosphate aldolase class Ia